MRAQARALRAACGTIAVLALTVACDANALDTAGTTQGTTAGTTTQGSSAGSSAGSAGTDAENGEDDPAPNAPTDPNAGQPVPLLQEGSEGEQVREAQARLQELGVFARNPSGYYGTMTSASVRALQKKEGLAQTGTMTAPTWSALREQTKAPTKEQLNPQTSYPIGDPDKRCRTGRVLCVSKESRTLAWMVDGEIKAAMDVRFGSEYTPTREGTFKVDFKSRNHHSTLYDSPMPYAMFFSGGQAVHYSADFAAAGYTGASHGCVNVREKEKIAKVFSEVEVGDKVIVYN